MKRDLELAAKVQQAILPVNPFELERVSCTYRFLPHDELGGDFLNIVPVSERHLSFYVVDVSSHGAPAGLIAVAISHAISMEARIHNLSSEKYSHFSASEVVALLHDGIWGAEPRFACTQICICRAPGHDPSDDRQASSAIEINCGIRWNQYR